VEYGRSGVVEGPVRLSTVARRRDISAICLCMPWNISPICRCMLAKAARESSRVGGAGGGGRAPDVKEGTDDDGVVVPVVGTAAAAAPAEEAMVSDTRLLALRDRRAYEWEVRGLGLEPRR